MAPYPSSGVRTGSASSRLTRETECPTTLPAGLGRPSDRLTQVMEDPPTLPGGAQLAICLTWVREGPPILPGQSGQAA